MTAIVTRQTAKGMIEISLDETGNFQARLDGKSVSLSIAGIQTVEELLSKPYNRATGEHLQKTGYTHLLGSKVAIHADEAAKLDAAARQEAEINPNILRSRRERLVDEINYLGDAAHEDHVASIERASATGVYRKPADNSAALEKARAALADFDAAHPEIVAAIEQERQESIERNMWN